MNALEAISPDARDDEKALWLAVSQNEWPRYAGARLGINHKRIDYLCGKWAGMGIYDYGVTVDLGWPTRNYRDDIQSNEGGQ